MAMMITRLAASLLLGLCLAPIRPVSASYIFNLGMEKVECFVTVLPKVPTILSGNFDVLDDEVDMQKLQVWLETVPQKGDKLWESDPGSSEGTFSMTMEAGKRVHLCFAGEWDDEEVDDAFAQFVQVGFNIRVHAIPRSLPNEENGPDLERALRVTEAAVSIETDWSNLMDHFEFLRSREAIHMQLTNEIMDRLMGWTLLEAFVVVVMAVCQVLYWRKFFEQRRYL